MLAGLSQAACAQDTERQESAPGPEDAVTPPEGGVLNLTLRDYSNMDAFDLERCDEEIDAATVSRTIIVCRKRTDAAASGFDKEKWEKDYAKRTLGQQPVEVAGEGITGKHAAGGGGTIRDCLPGLQKCPPPPALIIDVTALPQAPAGSDADRIARGLPPIGNDTGDRIPTELETKRDETSPAESEEPAGRQ